jgi:pentatricopeptide repeat protein
LHAAGCSSHLAHAVLQGRAGRPREATLQLAEMARLGVQPDAMAATALVDACARNGKMDMALSVFDELFGKPQATFI